MRTRVAHGTCCVMHLELHTGDSDQAVGFLSAVLGWRTEPVTASAAGRAYLALGVGDRVGGGIVECGETPAQWVPYVVVEGLDQITRRADEMGATVLMSPREGPGGSRSVVSTPASGVIALWEPRTHTGRRR
jgi:predicted enzyme related to lactoylglutathione lyase